MGCTVDVFHRLAARLVFYLAGLAFFRASESESRTRQSLSTNVARKQEFRCYFRKGVRSTLIDVKSENIAQAAVEQADAELGARTFGLGDVGLC